jgi:hypothetical protein
MYSAAALVGNCIIEMPSWYFEEAEEEGRMAIFMCCNSSYKSSGTGGS